ncbi:MAG: hypothetical protein HRU01_13210 [Myxococcales bacterium]|nr:hypothetical protein [Myxococcales bacterium]
MITKGAKGEVAGVSHGAELIAYADAVVARSENISATRMAIQASMGDAEVVDAAAVIANFQRMVRIADGTGIPIDGPMDVLSADLRHEIGINAFPSAEGRGKNGWLRRLASPLLRRVAARALRSR